MEFYLTTAGLAAFVNPANTGSNAITIDQIGVSTVALPGDPASHAGMLALPNELKRLNTFAGANVGDNVIHVTIRDETADVYSLRTFGLYTSTGVLLAYVTSAVPISEKSPSSMTLIAADFAFTAAVVAEIVFGETSFLNPPATSQTAGVVELATAEETAAGTDASRAVTPFGLKSLLTALLAGFSQIGHTHAAADVTSGVFAVARLPDLAQSKITGLVAALAGKAAAAHTHAISEITGLVAALAAKLAIADFTWANLVGKPNVAVQAADAYFRDIHAIRAGREGVVHLGDQSSGGRYIYANAAGNYEMPGGHLLIRNAQAWTTETFDPASKVSFNGSGRITNPGLELTLTSGLVNAAPWEGIGASDILLGGALYPAVQVAGYYGLRLRSQTNVLDMTATGGVTLNGNTVWHAGNFDPATKANLGVDVRFQDCSASRGDGTGLFGFGGVGSPYYLLFDGAAYNFANAPLKVNGHTVWTASNFDPTAKATLNQDVTFNAVRAYGGGGTGAVYLGGPARYIYFNGSEYEMPSAPIRNEGHIVWHAGNFSPAAKSNVGHTHTAAEITDLLDLFWPAGELKLYDTASAPAGARVLPANGGVVSRTTYARLFDSIGTRYGAGDGVTTFQLPDWRGVFFRGLDNGRGLDSGRALGVLQMSQNLSHSHSIPARSNQNGGNGYVEDASGEDNAMSTFTGLSGGSEARPTNQALLACITY